MNRFFLIAAFAVTAIALTWFTLLRDFLAAEGPAESKFPQGLLVLSVAPLLLWGCAVPRYRVREPLPHVSTLPQDTTRALLDVAEEEVDHQEMPALLARVETRDGRALSAVVGTRDLRRREAATRGDCMRVGSVAKMLVAVVAVRLEDDGVWSLDDWIERWLPKFPATHDITIAQLLSHHAGVPDVLDRFMSVAHATLCTRHVYTRDELIAKVAGQSRKLPPEHTYRYSNGNYIVLGAILEEATGRPVTELLREHVFQRAGVSDTRLLPDGPPPPCLLWGFDRDLIPFGHDVAPDDTSFSSLAWTSGGLSSTADDLAAIVRGIRDAALTSGLPAGHGLSTPTRR